MATETVVAVGAIEAVNAAVTETRMRADQMQEIGGVPLPHQ